MKFGCLSVLELSGPVQACNGFALPFYQISLIFVCFLKLIKTTSLAFRYNKHKMAPVELRVAKTDEINFYGIHNTSRLQL